ncbi:GNAT family N-acetyltransferase [Kocuria sp.]|uniref:GNAT family N-acetyltransferase n=1 Tax=Kocuria sp. TaxID=1871328 RepID=UPI0026DEE025|nr:N-acetyltransferase [Kocuria sp.]MDO5619512.1 N-acetyltransferase [Kocuria sp.]
MAQQQIQVRQESAEDADAVRTVLLSAFPTAEEADLVTALRADAAWLPEFSLVAEASESVIGHVLMTRCTVDGQPALALAPVSVLEKFQRQGVGTQLVEAVLEAARAAGENTVVVVGHPEYYPRFGFQRASDHGVTVPVDAPDDAVMVLALSDEPIPAGMVGYAEAFGL